MLPGEKLSFVIPCYRSEKTIGVVIEEIQRVMSVEYDGSSYEIVAVVDGSPDNVYGVLYGLASNDSRIKVVNFSKNFGQPNALMAGYRYASGQYIVTLDDDGQCPVNNVSLLVAALDGGADMAAASYEVKEQSSFKNLGSRLNEWMARRVIGIPDNFKMSNFYAFTSFLRDEVVRYENPYPYLSGLVFRATLSVVNVPMQERARMEGETGYTIKKLVKIWLNGLTSFSLKPLQVSFVLALVCFIAAFVLALAGIVSTLVVFWVIASIFFVGSLLMLMLGLLGEYIGRLFISSNMEPQYVVRDLINISNGVCSKWEEK